jgi:SAM-dependent methyltransferase
MNSCAARSETPICEAELKALLLQFRRENWHGIQPLELQEEIVASILDCKCDALLCRVLPHFELRADARILDIGSGTGSFVVSCRKRGFAAFGMEPDRIGSGGKLTAIEIASRRLEQSAFVSGVGESLPFPDASFDLITMNQVLEHVADQPRVVREAARVLKPGGALYVSCPNYLRFYEPHYKIFWLPFMPKWLGRWYLRLRGRNPVMLDQLTYTSSFNVWRLLAALGPEYKLIDLAQADFLRKRKTHSFATGRFRILSKATRLPLLGPAFLRFTLFGMRVRALGCEVLLIREARNSPA